MKALWSFLLLMVTVIAAMMWATDWLTLEGERTIYTVDCVAGLWDGLVCGGRLTAGVRYRFRASKSRGEVLHWIAGSPDPSGKMTGCTVHDRGNWTCKTPDGANPAIAQAMVGNRLSPTPGSAAGAVHVVAKWKWWAIRLGWPRFRQADY
jgi:hypothetical protein